MYIIISIEIADIYFLRVFWNKIAGWSAYSYIALKKQGDICTYWTYYVDSWEYVSAPNDARL